MSSSNTIIFFSLIIFVTPVTIFFERPKFFFPLITFTALKPFIDFKNSRTFYF